MGEGLELGRLEGWLAEHVGGYRGPCRVERFQGGQSNPTYRLSAASGELVLRRRPEGVVLPSAHQVDREFRVLRALAGSGVPVPRVHALCRDPGVLGSDFYVMDYVPGRVFFDARLPELGVGERGEVFRSMADTVAALHAVEPGGVGLGDFGRPGGYMERQLARWTRQYRLSETVAIPAMDRLMGWLPGRLPGEGEVRVVHGDLRLDNMLIHPCEPRVVAVFDWELSTLGDPLSDLAYCAMAWRLEPELFRGVAGCDLVALGIPSEGEFLARYLDRSGRGDLPHWEFYVAFNLFRLAAIIQGIAKRAADGTATDPGAAALGAKAGAIAERGWEVASRA